MAHFLAPQPPDPQLPVFFNVDGAVGAAPAQNKREDVLLVQFVFYLIAKSPSPTIAPALLAAAQAVQLTGMADAATIKAIRVHQESKRQELPETVVDGRVSPAMGGGYSYGSGLWTITFLNNSVRNRHLDIWPRIDKIPGCPDELKQMVKRTVVGM